MFPSFTGSTRPRRQVNLSGRNSNPFAALPASRASSSPQPGQNALAQAQQERVMRQQERERPPAARRIQRTWRGYHNRKEKRRQWRQEWDHKETWTVAKSSSAKNPSPYTSERECLNSLRLLVQFVSPHNECDVQRLHYFAARYLQSVPAEPTPPADEWTYPLLRLAKLALGTMDTKRAPPSASQFVDDFLRLLQHVAGAIPTQLAPYARAYFKTLAKVCLDRETENFELLQGTAVGILRPLTSGTRLVYEGFAAEFLTTPELPKIFGSLAVIAQGIKYEYLAEAVHNILSPSSASSILQLTERENLLWLLAYFIHFRRYSFSENHRSGGVPDALYVKVVSRLISFLADDIGTRMDTSISGLPIDSDSTASSVRSSKPLPAFVRSEILTLIDQENVSSLLANINVMPADAASDSPSEAAALASYALTLLRAFPRRGDEIRMWLYRGSTSGKTLAIRADSNLPAIKYFYQAASKTDIFHSISKDPRETVGMLRPDKPNSSTLKHPSSITIGSRDQQWRVILLFLELYTFVLKVMDDEEFLSGTNTSYNEHLSWTRKSALPLDQVRDLTVFLKNLAFSMYWYASEIAGIEATEAKTSLAEYFGNAKAPLTEKSQDEPPSRYTELSIAGVSGMTLAYLKGMVTGVLRMIYERE